MAYSEMIQKKFILIHYKKVFQRKGYCYLICFPYPLRITGSVIIGFTCKEGFNYWIKQIKFTLTSYPET